MKKTERVICNFIVNAKGVKGKQRETGVNKETNSKMATLRFILTAGILRAKEPRPAGQERMKGRENVDEKTKKPCAPVGEAGRDYNELGLYLHGETVKTAMELWEMLPGWMAARKMAAYDPNYNRMISRVIAENAEIILKAAREMAEWGQAECEPDKKGETARE